VRCITTNGGCTRFNPNIYADGKVCLSILGTWTGERGEEWSSAQGLESVLLSVQSLLSANPYENEPGFEGTDVNEDEAQAYIAKIQHESIRIAVIQQLERMLGLAAEAQEPARKRARMNSDKADLASKTNPSDPERSAESLSDHSAKEYDAEADFTSATNACWRPFEDLVKQRFLWYHDVYMRNVEKHSQGQDDNTKFEVAPFEHGGNGMLGMFLYKHLCTRLHGIMNALDEELLTWERLGAEQALQTIGIAPKLFYTFRQLKSKWNESRNCGARLEISLVKAENPFVWGLTLFGEPMTNLDGGVSHVKTT
jgi:ubiquitin-conjugating enzyme E2 Z